MGVAWDAYGREGNWVERFGKKNWRKDNSWKTLDIWCDLRYDMIYDMVWYDMIYDMVWYDIWYDGIIWYDVWYDLIYDMMVLYDMIWYDVWYDMIWYDMVCKIVTFLSALSLSVLWLLSAHSSNFILLV